MGSAPSYGTSKAEGSWNKTVTTKTGSSGLGSQGTSKAEGSWNGLGTDMSSNGLSERTSKAGENSIRMHNVETSIISSAGDGSKLSKDQTSRVRKNSRNNGKNSKSVNAKVSSRDKSLDKTLNDFDKLRLNDVESSGVTKAKTKTVKNKPSTIPCEPPGTKNSNATKLSSSPSLGKPTE